MTAPGVAILEQVVAASAEPVLLVRVDTSDWPVVLTNPAFEEIAGTGTVDRPFADVVEALIGRDSALDVSEALRGHQLTTIHVDAKGREYLLALHPIDAVDADGARYVAVFWRDRSGAPVGGDAEAQHALNRAKRRLRDLRREDPVTGLLNEPTFREVLAHDWAVAARDQGLLAVVVFALDEFDAYSDVFGRHAADSCLRRVAQTVQRCLRRASDVVARFDGATLVVLSHASDEDSVRDFAGRISAAVLDLGIHHPRSKHGRFVTVSSRVRAITVARGAPSAQEFLDELLVADR